MRPLLVFCGMIIFAGCAPRRAGTSPFAWRTAEISGKIYITPSGQSVLAFSKTPFFQKNFTFNPKHFFYFFVSDGSWKGLPHGLKAFSPYFHPGVRTDDVPAAWVPQALKEKVKPGSRVAVILFNDKVREVLEDLRYGKQPAAGDWLGTPVPPETAANREEGKKNYLARCAVCHGEKGDGGGPASLFLYPKPRDFTSGEFKFKTTLYDESPSDADLYRTLTTGMKGTGMPAWNFLSPKDRWNTIAYIKSFAVDSQTGKNTFVEKPAKHFLAIRQPAFHPERLRKGQALFFGKGKCTDCHGPSPNSRDGLPRGEGPSAPALVDDWGYPIRPADLVSGTFKRGNSPKEIYVTLTTGLPGTPMPPYRDTLSDAERWDLAFYVSGLNRRPHESR